MKNNSGVYLYQINELYSRLSSRIWLNVESLSKKIKIPIVLAEDMTGIYVNNSEDLQKTKTDVEKGKVNQFLKMSQEKGTLSEMFFPTEEYLPKEITSLEASAFYLQNKLSEASIQEMKEEFDKTGKIILRNWIFGTSDPDYSHLSSYGNFSKKWERDPFPDNNYGRLPQNLLQTIEYAKSKK